MIIITNSRVVGEADIAVEKDYDVASIASQARKYEKQRLANDQI